MTDQCRQHPGEHGPTFIRSRELTRRERITDRLLKRWHRRLARTIRHALRPTR